MGKMVAIVHDLSQYVPSLDFFGRLTSLELEPSTILTLSVPNTGDSTSVTPFKYLH